MVSFHVSHAVQFFPLYAVRLVYQNRFGWETFFAYPSLLTQDKEDSTSSQRDLKQLQTLDLKPLMTNVLVPTSNSWSPYIENIHFDVKTGLAVLAFDTPDQPFVTANIESAKALLSYIAARNQALPSCPGHGLTSYQIFLNNNGWNETTSEYALTPPICWIPFVVYEQTKVNAYEEFVEAMRNHIHPPSVIVDVRGNNVTESDDPYNPTPTKNFFPSHVLDNQGIWIVSYSYYYLRYFQQRLTVSAETATKGRILDVELIQDAMFEIPDKIKDAEYREDIVYMRSLAQQAAENDPELGRTEYMPPGEIESENLRPCFGGECQIGNLFVDAMRWKSGSDVAFIQSGGVRGPGWEATEPVKMSHIWEALP